MRRLWNKTILYILEFYFKAYPSPITIKINTFEKVNIFLVHLGSSLQTFSIYSTWKLLYRIYKFGLKHQQEQVLWSDHQKIYFINKYMKNYV